MTGVTIPVQPDRDAAVHFPTPHAATVRDGKGACHARLARRAGEYGTLHEGMPMIWSEARIRAGKACRCAMSHGASWQGEEAWLARESARLARARTVTRARIRHRPGSRSGHVLRLSWRSCQFLGDGAIMTAPSPSLLAWILVGWLRLAGARLQPRRWQDTQ
ncbi:MAG TPA: hypothetical protein VGN96_04830 [Roseococcus sp.]|jgi:hypothetical protein|nr:hypothetical protein [Roseococcus sp.]